MRSFIYIYKNNKKNQPFFKSWKLGVLKKQNKPELKAIFVTNALCTPVAWVSIVTPPTPP